jgi:hypothetical protein
LAKAEKAGVNASTRIIAAGDGLEFTVMLTAFD